MKWICIDDEKPEQDVTVLVYNRELRDRRISESDTGIRLGKVLRSGKLRPDGSMGFEDGTKYWMPLPPPPVEES